jgi:hypothetical protein
MHRPVGILFVEFAALCIAAAGVRYGGQDYQWLWEIVVYLSLGATVLTGAVWAAMALPILGARSKTQTRDSGAGRLSFRQFADLAGEKIATANQVNTLLQALRQAAHDGHIKVFGRTPPGTIAPRSPEPVLTAIPPSHWIDHHIEIISWPEEGRYVRTCSSATDRVDHNCYDDLHFDAAQARPLIERWLKLQEFVPMADAAARLFDAVQHTKTARDWNEVSRQEPLVIYASALAMHIDVYGCIRGTTHIQRVPMKGPDEQLHIVSHDGQLEALGYSDVKPRWVNLHVRDGDLREAIAKVKSAAEGMPQENLNA